MSYGGPAEKSDIFPEEEEQEVSLAKALKHNASKAFFERLLIGQSIRKFRKKAGFTQKALAENMKTAQSVIARIEKGRQNLTVGMLTQVAGALGKKVSIKIL